MKRKQIDADSNHRPPASNLASLVTVILILSLAGASLGQDKVLPWIRYTLQGEELVRAAKYHEALNIFARAERLEKNSTRLYINIAMTYKFLYSRERDPDRREEHYSLYLEYLGKVLTLDPIHPDARYLQDMHLGIVSVVVSFEKPEAADLFRVGLNALKTGAPSGARELLLKALTIEKHPDILKALGMAAYQQRDFESAAARLAESVKLNPIQHDAYMVLGDMAEQGKRYAAAREFYLKALASYPHHYAAMQKIALISKRMGRSVRFLNITDPVPVDKRHVAPDNLIQVRQLAVDLKANVFEVQCWLIYHQSRTRAREQHNRDLPGTPFEHTINRELDDLGSMLSFYAAQTETIGIKLPHFEILAKLDKEGLLKGAAFFYRWRDEFAQDFKAYRKNHFNDFYRMFDEHL